MGERKLGIVRIFDGTFTIIEIRDTDWIVLAGPYLTHEEALPDLRILQYESRNNF